MTFLIMLGLLENGTCVEPTVPHQTCSAARAVLLSSQVERNILLPLLLYPAVPPAPPCVPIVRTRSSKTDKLMIERPYRTGIICRFPTGIDPLDAAIRRIFDRIAAEQIPAEFSVLAAKLGDEREKIREQTNVRDSISRTCRGRS
ncbi:hypothetical protein [Erythrobacter sp.]|uniref:hypothetical protein n=1 Tax=Erythrobacter sp. TaxID=1042 RepID=UPI0025E839D7|nr:hypothetical protein [Erythrobacter sp.]